MNTAQTDKLSFTPTSKKLLRLILVTVLSLVTISCAVCAIWANNPTVIYLCDKDIADTIISKADIIAHGRDMYGSTVLKPVVIYVSEFSLNGESSLSYGQIEILYIPTIGRSGANVMEYSAHDAPYIRPYYTH